MAKELDITSDGRYWEARQKDANLLKINDWSFVKRVADRADYVCFPFSMQLGMQKDYLGKP